MFSIQRVVDTCCPCIEKVKKHMLQAQESQLSYPDLQSKHEPHHQNMRSQNHHFPRIWHPKHSQDALRFEHKLHLHAKHILSMVRLKKIKIQYYKLYVLVACHSFLTYNEKYSNTTCVMSTKMHQVPCHTSISWYEQNHWGILPKYIILESI